MPDAQPRRLAARWIGWSSLRVWGLTPPQRLRRSLVRAGIWDTAAWTGSPPAAARSVLLFLGDTVYDDELVAALAGTHGTMVMAEGVPVAANAPPEWAEPAARALQGDAVPPELVQVRPDELVGVHRRSLRKRDAPVVIRVSDANIREVEHRLFGASYKGVTDVVTKYVWPVPARIVTGWCAAARISPSTVTLVGLALAIVAFLLFRDGQLWGGLAAAWGMTFLDTVDGKLARVTLTSSRVGDVLDHGLDLIHPPFWWWAWWQGSGNVDPQALLVVLVGYALLRVQEGLFIKMFGIELHVWKRFDSTFRLVTARRNPLLIVLTVGLAMGAPDIAFEFVAGWTFISLLVHSARILMAAQQREEGGTIASWLEG